MGQMSGDESEDYVVEAAPGPSGWHPCPPLTQRGVGLSLGIWRRETWLALNEAVIAYNSAVSLYTNRALLVVSRRQPREPPEDLRMIDCVWPLIC